MLTTMAINAQRLSIDHGRCIGPGSEGDDAGTPTAATDRATDPLRSSVPTSLSEEDQRRMKAAAMACPVHRSLHPDVKIPVTFLWGPGKVVEQLVEAH